MVKSSRKQLDFKAAAYFNNSFDKLGRCSSSDNISDRSVDLESIDDIRQRKEAARLKYHKIRSNICSYNDVKPDSYRLDHLEISNNEILNGYLHEVNLKEEAVREEKLIEHDEETKTPPSLLGVKNLISTDTKKGSLDDCNNDEFNVITF